MQRTITRWTLTSCTSPLHLQIPGPTLKRGMPRAQGRYNRILKRTTHITIGVSEKA